ncbi:hypothetical protein [Actinoplanes sp. NPDC049265]|uniref:hypothetical protein n=1 Tax=Actinoplanes sp. NPDC049265 TaxID=3363902 RepID=UPI0037212D95
MTAAPRDGAEVVELTDHLDPGVLTSFPAGTRLICRRERPHPGAQLCRTQALLLDGALAAAEPKKLRYRLLHVAAKLTRN